ncbi:L-threonylcarbamoyladenylate synthase [Terribacillus sp. DMT04]|uniref:L-threonylcarbamoyladenylate synthase n=1 Tax=Terribacillus sp. DMT04 TaxID=2850441 RepID=UPI001C2CAC23|nr:L-threonylcarbamoyladenylate synthase [Terribacillus sp. DMT04]QXE03471.1 threonylcarbamoyl-AMP synthase [Terribacillus sp. DMT04]
METKHWTVSEQSFDKQAMSEAAALLKQGEAVAFPTETVYGLGADATNEQAVRKIFEAKGRPSDNPLIVHVANINQLENLVEEVPDVAYKLLEAFSPGPLTLILKSKGTVAPNVSAGLDSIGIRIPSHPVGLRLLEEAAIPIAAPSANISGRPSPTKAAHVVHDLNGRIAGIMDGGPTGIGLESTVLDCTEAVPVILRPGGVTAEAIQKVIGTVMIDPGLAGEQKEKPKAPGMKYTHYAPEAPLYLVKENMQQQADKLTEAGEKVGIIATEELAATLDSERVQVCGTSKDLATVAEHLYDALRHFKKSDVSVILCESFPKQDVGAAIMNRLEKAATGSM